MSKPSDFHEQQAALADQILATAAQQQTSLQGAPPVTVRHVPGQSPQGLGDVKTMEDARKLARQIVMNKSLNLLQEDNPNHKIQSLVDELKDLRAASESATGFGPTDLSDVPIRHTTEVPSTINTPTVVPQGIIGQIQQHMAKQPSPQPLPQQMSQPPPTQHPHPATPATNVEHQLQQQEHQLALLSQLQKQLMSQHQPTPQSLPEQPPYQQHNQPRVSPVRPRPNDPSTFLSPVAAAAGVGAGGFVTPHAPAAVVPMPQYQPPPVTHYNYPPPPVVMPAGGQVAPFDAFPSIQSGISAPAEESPEELEAREQAHRIMVDFIAQKNLTNLLTEKLAEKSQEADSLRARLATGEGTESIARMSEALGMYEKELSSERARTLALEHELQKLNATYESNGLPLPKSRDEYENEISALRKKIEMQDVVITDINLRANRERQELQADMEGRIFSAKSATTESLQREIDLLRAKLKEKKGVNQELQDMLKLHLRYNSDLRTKNLLQQPQWVHPLLKDPQVTIPELRDPLERVDL